MKTPLALTIAGSDPGGGAGLQADLKVFKAFGVHGLSVASALTAQNTKEVSGIMPVSGDFFKKQLDTLLSDMLPGALKTGMLLTAENIRITARCVEEYALKNLVVDPVSISSSGTALVEEGVLDLIKDLLFPLATVITPNIYEASLLSGMMVEDTEQMTEAAQKLLQMGPKCVIVTGGHLMEEAVDIFHDGKVTIRLMGKKLAGDFHGTGCVFSAAITASLAKGETPEQASRGAKEFMEKRISGAFYPGGGMGVLI